MPQEEITIDSYQKYIIHKEFLKTVVYASVANHLGSALEEEEELEYLASVGFHLKTKPPITMKTARPT